MMRNMWDDISNSHLYEAERHLTALSLVTETNGVVLDIGCGHGFVLHRLREENRYVLYGIDVSFNNIRQAKSGNDENVGLRKSVNYLVCDATKLCFRDNAFDVVISTDVIEHIGSQELLLREMERVTKKSGEIVVTFPAYLFVLLRKAGLFKPHQPIDNPPSPRRFMNMLSQNKLKAVAFKSTGKVIAIVFEQSKLRFQTIAKEILTEFRFLDFIKSIFPEKRTRSMLPVISNRRKTPDGKNAKYSTFRHIFSGNVAFRIKKEL